jgi:glycosyltransferase involved in cell wall biosynthesis
MVPDRGQHPVADVSVLTPSLNYGRFIEDAFLSVLHQQDLSVQHIVQDGGSSDETLDVLSRFDAIDWSSEPDGGQSQALNNALRRASGRWITWLNADEFYLPGSLSHLMQVGERSGADVVYGDCVFVDERGRLLRLLGQHRFSARVLREYGCYISSNSTIFRRSILREDPFDEGLRKIMDWDLYMRLLQNGATFAYVPYPVGAFRMHPDQVTAVAREWHAEYAVVMSRYRLATDIDHLKALHRRVRWLHLIHKAFAGSYRRQLRARPLRGSDIRWFRSSIGYANSLKLLERCYG